MIEIKQPSPAQVVGLPQYEEGRGSLLLLVRPLLLPHLGGFPLTGRRLKSTAAASSSQAAAATRRGAAAAATWKFPRNCDSCRGPSRGKAGTVRSKTGGGVIQYGYQYMTAS